MSTAPFDPAAYKRTTTEQWQAAAEPWHRWGPTLEAWLGEGTEAMLDMAGGAPRAARRPDTRRLAGRGDGDDARQGRRRPGGARPRRGGRRRRPDARGGPAH